MRAPPLARVAFDRAARWALVPLALLAVGWIGLETLVRGGRLVDLDRFARPSPSLRVVDREGQLLRVVRSGPVDRRWVPLREISPTLISAVLAAEDGRFFAHRGVDGWAVARAAVGNLVPGRRRSGASTITQQLVKRVYGRPNGLWDKGIEVLRAMSLERVVSKDEILEQYLNRLPFGDGIEGVARASEAYFGHGPERMTPSEAALLAGIPQSPAFTEPRRHLRRALARRNHILAAMRAHGWITAAAQRSARLERAGIIGESLHPSIAMRFTDEVVRQLREGRLSAHGGTVATSLQRGLQVRAESLVREGVERFSRRGAVNGAAIVVDHRSGEVFAYVGAARAEAAGGAMDLLRRPRQPGSTLKPFVYERFFEDGATPATLVADLSRRWTGHAGAQYDARDYDGEERGVVRARVALASSLNLAALDVAGRVGQEAVVSRLRALGFSRARSAAELGAGVVLGGLDVSAIELVEAYSTLARGGERVSLSYSPGAIVTGSRVMRADAVEVTSDVLRDVDARRDAFGRSLAELAPGADFALKTGTSSGWRDAWCAVYDTRWTALVWIGDPSGAPMSAVSGFEAAAPVAVRLLEAARRTNRDPPVPAAPLSGREVELCAHSGLRAGPRCARVVSERVSREVALPRLCDAHSADGRDLAAPHLAGWIGRHHPPRLSVREAEGPLLIASPAPGTRLLSSTPGGRLRLVAVVGGAEVGGVSWRVDSQPVDGAWTMRAGGHLAEAWLADGRRATSEFQVMRAP